MLITLNLLLAVFFAITGAMKLLSHPHMVEAFTRFGYPLWLMKVPGVIEVVAAPLFVLAIGMPEVAVLASLLIAPVMVGATYVNFVKRPAAFGWGTCVLLVLCLIPGVEALF